MNYYIIINLLSEHGSSLYVGMAGKERMTTHTFLIYTYIYIHTYLLILSVFMTTYIYVVKVEKQNRQNLHGIIIIFKNILYPL